MPHEESFKSDDGVQPSAIRALVVDLADVFLISPTYVAAVRQLLKYYHPVLEEWGDRELGWALRTGGMAEGIAAYLKARGVAADGQGDECNEEDGEVVNPLRCMKSLLTSVGETLLDLVEREPMPVDMATVEMLRRLKKELRCLVGAVWQTYGARHLVQGAKLADLFDAVVDKEQQDAFGLRSHPAPDLLLKLCSNMAVSPYETVGIFSLQTGSVLAASTGTFGLVVGRPSDDGSLPFPDQQKQMLKQGADVVVNSIKEVDASMLCRWYDCGIHEDAWNLVFTAYNSESELYRQALTVVGNGYMGCRGCFEGCHTSPYQRPGTYVGGVFNTREPVNEAPPQAVLVPLPNWCLIELKIGGGAFVNPLEEELLYYQHNLCFRDGLLERSITFRSAGDRETRLDVRRVLSMKQQHVGAVQYTLTPLNYDAPITLRSAIDANSPSDDLVLLKAHSRSGPGEAGLIMTAKTARSGVHVAIFVRHHLRQGTEEHPGDEDVNATQTILEEPRFIAEEFTFNATCDQSYTLEKLLSIWTSNDVRGRADTTPVMHGIVPWLEQQVLRDIRHHHRFKQIYEASRQAWKELWDKADVFIEGDRLAQKMARLNTYHLLIAANPHPDSTEAGLTIKGLTGDGCGFVMWDEVFQFPFYLTKFPDVCKAHLRYRHRRLPHAKANAARHGHKGALYPWHSADSGDEVSRPRNWFGPHFGWEAHLLCYHVNHAVFYNCWKYYTETNAKDFLEESMLEMVLEIAMFWQSVAEFSEADERYHIKGVIGPNLYNSSGVDDNAYTNVMTVWCFGKLTELLDAVHPEVRSRVCEEVGFTPEVLSRIDDIRLRMCVHFSEEGVMQQFAGYDKLPRLDFERYTREELANLKAVLSSEGIAPEQFAVSENPDTLMLYYLLSPKEVRDTLVVLGYDIHENETEYLRKTFAYYCQRTLHFMPLSFTILAKVGQMCWKTDYVWDWFMEGVKADLFDREGTTHLGVHLGHMAATLDIVLSTFVGLKALKDTILIEPSLPPTWTKVRFRRILNGSWYSITVTKKKVKLSLEITEVVGAPQLPISIGGNKLILCPWSSVGVKYHRMSTMKEFYDLMHKTKFVRHSIVNAYMAEVITPAIQSQVESLRHALQTLEKLPFNEQGLALVGLDARKRINLDLNYEITELKKDICFLQEGPEELYKTFMRSKIEDFDQLVAKGIEFLGGDSCFFQTLVTDRDGTINNYCGRYKSSIQSAYNSIFISRFATLCCRHAAILTAAPLQDMINVSVNPDNVFVYAASKGREFLDMNGHYQTAPMDAKQRALLKQVSLRLKQLVEAGPYQKFALIGSGLQTKFGQLTVSRQDMSNSISPGESDAFLKVVQDICHEVSPDNGLVIHDTGLDIEILPRLTEESQAESATFHKGKGLEFLNERLQLDVKTGPNLVCGDTSSDVPMVEAAMALCPDKTYAIFVTKDKQLIGRVHAICPRSLIVPSPDVLVSIMHECARIRDGRSRLRLRSFSSSEDTHFGGSGVVRGSFGFSLREVGRDSSSARLL